jgi:hypothetical protein
MAEKQTWDGIEKMADDMKKRSLQSSIERGPNFSDILLSALAEPKRGIFGYFGGKYAEAMRRNVQANIATSQKFFVSNSLVEHAYLASLSRPQTLISMLERAIPPFTNMWIEWDENFRQDIINREMKKAGQKFDDSKSDVANKLGYHIMQVNGEYMFTNYMVAKRDIPEIDFKGGPKEDQVIAMPIGFYMRNDRPFTLSEPNIQIAHAAKAQSQAEFDFEMEVTAGGLIGQWYRDKWEINDTGSRLDNCFLQIQAAPMHWMVSQQKFADGWTPREMMEYKTRSMISQAGDGRFLIALLGLLNYDLIVHETAIPPQKIDHVMFGRRVPKNEYKLVSIQLPKPRGKRIYEQMFTGHGTPKKEHWRRGHWRKVRDKSGNVKKRVWIGEMKVGNPDLGTIIHDYSLEGRKT